ncbi:MAG TPA: YdeI/OmpD-associated family protein [Actinomycetota bacterium]|nr:YdeI/OmpD-associated family protein [Actinomycetota bacterium]
MKPVFFERSEDLRTWLEEHHGSADELWVGLYKKASGRPSVTWPEVVDEALCFGWIDGIRKSIDAERYMNRLTPRRTKSHWSAVNVRRFGQLKRLGRVRPAGQRAFDLRRKDETGAYSYEQRHQITLDPALEKRFRAKKEAWSWFLEQAPSYRTMAVYWVMSATREEARVRRLQRLIEDSALERRIPR